MTVTPDRVTETLAALGDTPGDVIDRLASIKCHGRPGSACFCPVANYVRRTFRPETVVVFDDKLYALFQHRDGRSDQLWARVPPQVGEAVRLIDDLKVPQLTLKTGE